MVEFFLQDIVDFIKFGEILMDMFELECCEVLQEVGMDKDMFQNVEYIYGMNIFIDDMKGIQYFNEMMEFVIEGFEEVFDDGLFVVEFVQGMFLCFYDV